MRGGTEVGESPEEEGAVSKVGATRTDQSASVTAKAFPGLRGETCDPGLLGSWHTPALPAEKAGGEGAGVCAWLW